jgi:zeaxanthin glucosyltransferase
MRVLAITIPQKGHLHPLIPTLQRLQRRGHDVALAAVGDAADAVAAAGFRGPFHPIEAPPPPSSFVTAGAEFAARLGDPAWLSSWIEALLVDAVPGQLPGMHALLRQQRPDALVLDPMVYAAVIAAERAGVPWLGVSSSLNPVTPPSWSTALTQTLARLAARRDALFADAGVRVPAFAVSDALSPAGTVCFTTAAYLGGRAPPPGVHLVGAPLTDDDVDGRVDPRRPPPPLPPALDGADPRAWVYASFGSQAFFQPRLLRAIFTAARGRGLRVVAAVGDLVDDPAFVADAPDDAVLFRHAPQLPVLARVGAMVGHGGANSVVEALWAGRPPILLPLCNDQPLQARFLTEAGAGVVVDSELPDAALLAALDEALQAVARPPIVAAVARVQAGLRAGGGPARVADLVEGLTGGTPR